jgi:hypothetical protein
VEEWLAAVTIAAEAGVILDHPDRGPQTVTDVVRTNATTPSTTSGTSTVRFRTGDPEVRTSAAQLRTRLRKPRIPMYPSTMLKPISAA